MAYITLSRSALFHNLDTIKQHSRDVEKVALVLKDNAYGHGLEIIAGLASEYGISRAVVRTHVEAVAVSRYFNYILVLADIPKEASETICYTINAIEQIELFPKGCRVELKVDSGMHRNGITPSQLEAAFKMIKAAGLQFEGLFTHQRSGDTLSSEWFWQRKNFEQIKAHATQLAKRYSIDPLRFHSNNSASLFRSFPEDEAMVRVGIAVYGCLEMDSTLMQPELKPVMSLWGEKIASRELLPSQRVGYNGTYTADDAKRVSTYDIGYADGLFRTLSNNYVSPEGKPLLGRVSMDSCSFGADDENLLIFDDANLIAKVAGTIGYEIMVGMRSYIKRIVIE
ncbi:MAG: alanine racemase [Campylobacterota bacterium]|nr:alanine racemase [Campylobacterota bacterium]